MSALHLQVALGPPLTDALSLGNGHTLFRSSPDGLPVLLGCEGCQRRPTHPLSPGAFQSSLGGCSSRPTAFSPDTSYQLLCAVEPHTP